MSDDDIFKLLATLHVSRPIVRTTRSIVFPCPLAPWKHATGGDRHPSCTILIEPDEESTYRCFTCHSHGTAVQLVTEINVLRGGDTLGALLPWVASVNRIDLEARLNRAIEASSRPPSVPIYDYPTFPDSELDAYRGAVPQYAIDRGISLKSCREWELGFDRAAHDERLVFPVRDIRGFLVGIVRRTIWPDREPRFRNEWGFQKTLFLYGEHLAARDTTPIVVAEGMISTVMLRQAVGCRAVGTLGNRVAPRQAQKIASLAGVGPIFSMFDADAGGDLAREELDDTLGSRIAVIHARLPDGHDPASVSPEIVINALDAVGFPINSFVST